MLYVGKPHIKLRNIVIMANELSEKDEGGVPAWMRKESTGTTHDNIDASDLAPPQLKMLAGMSPEVMNAAPGAAPGNFWLTILNQNLGREVTGSMVLRRKSYAVWAPRGGSPESKGPLATSSNGTTWDAPNQTFEVKFFGDQTVYKWRIGKLVSDFRADDFGSQKPGDPHSKPIATLTYNMLWEIDMPNGRPQLCVLTASRTMVKPTRVFYSAIETVAPGVDYYFQRYRLVQRRETGPTGDPYFLYDYQYIGNQTDKERAMRLKALHAQYAKSGFVADAAPEGDDPPTRQAPGEAGVAHADVDSIEF